MNQRYCHDRGNSVQIRGCSKIVGWNPPSPSIKMSERVSNLERWQILRGKKEKEKEKRKKNSRGRSGTRFTRSFVENLLSSGRNFV